MISRKKFLVLGRAGMDLYADPPGTEIENADSFFATLGGSAANIAAGIVKLGGQASIVTTVSNDAVGTFTLNALKKFGVETEYVSKIGGEARNSLAVVETRNENCQSVIYRNGAADFELSENDIEKINFRDFGALIITGTSLAIEPSRAATMLSLVKAKAASIPIILDVDYRPYSWASAEEAKSVCSHAASLCDVVIGNDLEFAVMGGGIELAKHFASTTAKIVIYKMGEKGSIAFSESKIIENGIFYVEALKPTGAGDAFMAGFATSLANGQDLETSVKRGSAAAAIVVTRVGCARAMPNEIDLNTFINTHPLRDFNAHSSL